MANRLLCYWLAVLALGATGCDLVKCTHPIADEATARYDERLQGIWRVEPLPEPDAPPAEDGPQQQFAIGKHPTKPNVQQWVGLEVKDDGEIVVQRLDVPAAIVGKHHYLSMPLNPDDKAAPVWMLMRYHVVDENQVLLHLPERDAFSLAVREGKLAGMVKLAPPKAGAAPAKPREEIVVTATTAELQTTLEAAGGPALFTAKPGFRLRRVK